MSKKRDYQRRNFGFALLQGTFMRINLAFVDSSTVLSAFIYKLTGSNIMVGLAGSMMTAGWMWPQLLVSNLLEHRQRKMPYYALGMGIRVFAWLAIFYCTIRISAQNPILLTGCFLGLYFLSSSAMGVSTLPYMDIVSKAIEPHRRARFFSLRQFCGGFFSIWVGFLVHAVLGNEKEFNGILGWITQTFRTITMYFIHSICGIETELRFPDNYALLFICAVVASLFSFISFLGVREPIHPVNAKRQPIWQHLKQGPHFLRTDLNYRRFIFFRIGLHFASMATPFYTTYALKELGVPEATIGFFHRMFCPERCHFKCDMGLYRREIWCAMVTYHYCWNHGVSTCNRFLFGYGSENASSAILFPYLCYRRCVGKWHDGGIHGVYVKHCPAA